MVNHVSCITPSSAWALPYLYVCAHIRMCAYTYVHNYYGSTCKGLTHAERMPGLGVALGQSANAGASWLVGRRCARAQGEPHTLPEAELRPGLGGPLYTGTNLSKRGPQLIEYHKQNKLSAHQCSMQLVVRSYYRHVSIIRLVLYATRQFTQVWSASHSDKPQVNRRVSRTR